jgi:anhydro-N-acetylmuramic acid kinase
MCGWAGRARRWRRSTISPAPRHRGATPLAFLNLGGVGNLTWVDPRQPAPEAPGALLAFDTGPANAPVNDLMQARGQGGAGRRRRAGRQGGWTRRALAAFCASVFLPHAAQVAGPRRFSRRLDMGNLGHLSDADAAATLTAAAAAAVARGAEHFPARHPPAGHRGRAAQCAVMAELPPPAPESPVEAAGLNGDMLEAQAFAFLAVRVARGMACRPAPGTTGVGALVGGGKVGPD